MTDLKLSPEVQALHMRGVRALQTYVACAETDPGLLTQVLGLIGSHRISPVNAALAVTQQRGAYLLRTETEWRRRQRRVTGQPVQLVTPHPDGLCVGLYYDVSRTRGAAIELPSLTPAEVLSACPLPVIPHHTLNRASASDGRRVFLRPDLPTKREEAIEVLTRLAAVQLGEADLDAAPLAAFALCRGLGLHMDWPGDVPTSAFGKLGRISDAVIEVRDLMLRALPELRPKLNAWDDAA
ncbi:hypothetical protein [Deinococcus soli (ex Cha et al. 2016)]|uniref:Uncharacterized protein n=2 Tax=Deinococcus soli (ex Cha et al. 2016) TaxID=1309411 RepID=A0ACC6KFM0_9DEIO|nr:hypothetical protein [Deinococcus soli (ex Cha et al. 2016)]MDR6218355.1 hypothetical protein [Deinococcus soli (ex Cha et al. 2016)]MDR6329095.1 hypothetical protein [Deinococcus soli (ex Cha et al. 2016)]MDR6751368.1 hypothetical protein [Deinococcus soli (ex Cha et al. 2016)]